MTSERAGEKSLRYCVEDRACKHSTMVDYRHTVGRVLVAVFGPLMLEKLTAPMTEAWRASLSTSARTRNKQLTILNGIFRRAQKRFGLQRNPVVEIERMREPRHVNLDVFSPEEVLALARRRLRRLGRARASKLCSRRAAEPQERQDPVGADGAAGGRNAGAPRPRGV